MLQCGVGGEVQSARAKMLETENQAQAIFDLFHVLRGQCAGPLHQTAFVHGANLVAHGDSRVLQAAHADG